MRCPICSAAGEKDEARCFNCGYEWPSRAEAARDSAPDSSDPGDPAERDVLDRLSRQSATTKEVGCAGRTGQLLLPAFLGGIPFWAILYFGFQESQGTDSLLVEVLPAGLLATLAAPVSAVAVWLVLRRLLPDDSSVFTPGVLLGLWLGVPALGANWGVREILSDGNQIGGVMFQHHPEFGAIVGILYFCKIGFFSLFLASSVVLAFSIVEDRRTSAK